MSELATYYREFAQAGAWIDEDPNRCGCRGGGWFLSEVDTWHKCPVHGRDVPHPEED